MTFDPRKTQVLADFAAVMRGADALHDPRAAAGDVKPAVVVGRTVVASGEPRSLALAKTQVWRSELTLETKTGASGETRERAEVHVDESVMQHLLAEVWAGQLAQTSRLMVTEVRRSVVDVQATFVETPRTQPSTRPTPIATETYEPVKIPRRFEMPDAKTLRITGGVICVLGAAIVVAAVMSERRDADAASASALLKPAAASSAQSQPVDVKSTWPAVQPTGAARKKTAPARNSAENAPMIAGVPHSASAQHGTEVASNDAEEAATDHAPAEAVHEPSPNRTPQPPVRAAASTAAALKPAHATTTPTIATTSLMSPRAAVDALIAGKQDLALARYKALAKNNPNDPVYEAAARILEDAQQRRAE
jgi:hypothetical protein